VCWLFLFRSDVLAFTTVDFFAKLFWTKKVLADGTVRLFVDLSVECRKASEVFCEAFLQKSGFWLLLQK